MSPSLTNNTSDIDDIGFQQNQKIFDIYNIYRLVLSLILLISFYFRPVTSALGTINPDLFIQVVSVYTAFNVLIFFRAFLPKNRTWANSQFISVILIDLVFLVLISYTCGGVSSGMATLLNIPVASGSLLFRIRLSTFFAAVGSILAIYSELYLYLTIDERILYFVQAGLLGLTLFVVSGSLQYLGGRIRQNELLNRQQAENIQSLQEMNNQIIERMNAGILVVNLDGIILNSNDAARKFISASELPGKKSALPEILSMQLEQWQKNSTIKSLPFRFDESARDLQSSFAYLNPGAESNILIFLEDCSLLTSRAQQLKLMSLGRLTASIAHEVRNPLGAISHASQLLNESETISDNDQRLLEIISSHTNRVNRIIESILELSRNRAEDTEQLLLFKWMEQFVTKFSNSQATPVDIEWQVEPKEISVQFNPGQLEQLITNLCENGLRYSEKSTGKSHVRIEISANLADNNPVLRIMDDGTGIPEELKLHIFEPFFTTEQQGTGLGLFICKEICDANQALLSYLPDYNGKNCFQINFTHSDRKFL